VIWNQNKFVGIEVLNGKMLDKTICVTGLGYIGLPTASLLGTKDFQVHGVDVSEHAFSSSIKERNKTCIHDPFIRKINYSDPLILRPIVTISIESDPNGAYLRCFRLFFY
jgi:lactate dehydrogenase-like 2-hydroxyacid dehydrogenase